MLSNLILAAIFDVESFLQRWSYLGLIGVLIACGLGLPVPEDIPLLAGGYLVHRGAANLYLMMASGMIGVIAGDSMLFLLGRHYGRTITQHRFMRRITTPARILWAEQKFEHYGNVIIFAGRFMPGARAVLFMTAGICRVPYWKFVLFNGFAAAISVPVWIYLGARFGGVAHEYIDQYISKHGKAVFFMLVAGCLIAWILFERFRHKKQDKKIMAETAAAQQQSQDPTAE